jgi:hypothetical protein
MKRMRIMGLCLVAVFALAAVFAGSAFAKAQVLTLKTAKGALTTGQEIRAESSDLKFVTTSGNLECSSNILKGTVQTNNAKKDEGEIATESSTGEEPGGICHTTTQLGPASILAEHLPWPVNYQSKGTSEVKKGKAGKVAFTSTFPGAGGAKCTYEASKVKSTFNTSGVITQTVSEQVFKVNKKTSNPACPTSGKLSGTFKLFSGSEPVEAELK